MSNPLNLLMRLTAREHEVLNALVNTGRSAKHIAFDLGISEKTLSVHTQRVYAKVGVHSRVDLIKWAHSNEENWNVEQQSSGISRA